MDLVDKTIEECSLTKDHCEKHDEGRRRTPICICWCKQPGLLRCRHSSHRAQFSRGQRHAHIEIEDLQTRHLNSEIRINQWSNCGKHIEEHPSCSARMAREEYHSVDRQHGGLTLDLNSREVLQGVCRKQSVQNNRNKGRSHNSIKMFPQQTRPRWSGK